MGHEDLKKYCDRAIQSGATHAKVIDPASVVTAPWVRLKCRFGCPGYGKRYSCPPDTPSPEEMRAVLDGYKRAILVHREIPDPKDPLSRKSRVRFLDELVALEGEMFKDGNYKAFAVLAGPCHLCKECGKLKNAPCLFGDKARPSMEACGIDVYGTARDNGFFIQTLREKTDPRNEYCLMLVD